jgi:hypothetical protein
MWDETPYRALSAKLKVGNVRAIKHFWSMMELFACLTAGNLDT